MEYGNIQKVQCQFTRDDIDRADGERKHLESLLKDRISFLLLFAPVLVAAAYNVTDKHLEALVLSIGSAIVLLLGLAIVRTTWLVDKALKEIRSDNSHPYTRYYRAVPFPWNANWTLLLVPLIFFLMFAYLAVHAWRT